MGGGGGVKDFRKMAASLYYCTQRLVGLLVKTVDFSNL